MIPDKLGKELKRDSAEPLKGTVVSVQPTASSPRDLHARIENRWDTARSEDTARKRRWPAPQRLLFLVGAGVLAWMLLVFAIWSLFQAIL